MRYLVTGGAGFIGSHLAEALLARGDEVVVLDDVSTGRIENLAGLLGRPGFQFVRESAEHAGIVNSLLGQCDAVFHLASAVGVKLVVERPVHAIRATIHSAEVVLEAANRFGRPVLLTSSSEVYGKGVRSPFAEDDDVLLGATRHRRWCYAFAKGIDEFLGLAYHREFGLPVVIVRLFNTVGPRQLGSYGMVLPRFARAALTGAPLEVYGDGRQSRCFCHVSDAVEALLRLLAEPAAAGRVFNVGSDEEISILGLAELVVRLAGSASPIVRRSYQEAYGDDFDDLQRRAPCLDRIRATIPFGPRMRLEETVRSVLDDQRRRLAEEGGRG